MNTSRVGGALALLTFLLPAGCAPPVVRDDDRGPHHGVTIEQIEELRSREALLPVAPDSVVDRYARSDPSRFHAVYHDEMSTLALLIDSLNAALPSQLRIDTFSIDHTIENIGVAGRNGTTITLSSSYFLLYDDPMIRRSVIFHEFGHVYYDAMPSSSRDEVGEIWRGLQEAAAFYVLNDGEYSGNARFGGHPEEGPAELFASAFNLFNNRDAEVLARIEFLEPGNQALVRRMRVIIRNAPVLLEGGSGAGPSGRK